MARFDTLPADQQAVLRLLLKQGSSYDEIAGSLKLEPAAVRDRAHSACAALGPLASAPAPAERSAIIDHLLGQGDAAGVAPAALQRSESARAWAAAVASELGPLSPRPLPEIPAPDGAEAPATARADGPAQTLTGAAPQRSSRTGGAILLLAGAILGALAIGFFVGRASKDGGSGPATPAKKVAGKANVIGQANLTAAKGANAAGAIGVAQFARQSGKDKVNVLVQGLPRIGKGNGYGVWLTSQTAAPKWLGYFTAITTDGKAAAQSDLKVDPRSYDSVLITHQRGKDPTRPGAPVLSGQIQFPTS